MKPWADAEHYSYKGLPTGRCLGCGKGCSKSSWGWWCHLCNVTRMRRINKGVAQLARSIGDEVTARELEAE